MQPSDQKITQSPGLVGWWGGWWGGWLAGYNQHLGSCSGLNLSAVNWLICSNRELVINTSSSIEMFRSQTNGVNRAG